MKKLLYPPSPFRPVFLRTGEVLSPDERVTDILRTNEHILVSIQTGAPNTLVVEELAASLDPTHELGAWVLPFANGKPFDLRAFHTNPLAYLQAQHPEMIRKYHCYPHYIPRALREPWAQL